MKSIFCLGMITLLQLSVTAQFALAQSANMHSGNVKSANILTTQPGPQQQHAADTIDSLGEQLLSASSSMNTELPQRIDDNTRLDRTSVFDTTFVYHFTLLQYPARDIDSDNFANVMREELHDSICQSPEMALFLSNGVPLIYAYSGMYGESLASVIIDQQSCDHHHQMTLLSENKHTK